MKESIIGKEQWNFLLEKIELIVVSRILNPNDAIGHAKDLIESIAKTVITDHGGVCENMDVGPLVKEAVRKMSFYGRIEGRDQELAIRFASSVTSIFSGVGDLRNNHGTIGHGRDYEHPEIDQYLVDLAIESVDTIGSFLIKAHHSDLHHRYRLRYEDNPDFNSYYDETNESVKLGELSIAPSRVLFTDIEAYKSELKVFQESPEVLIEALDLITEKELIVSRISSARILFSEHDVKNLQNVLKQQEQVYKEVIEPLIKSIDFSHIH